MRSTKTTFRLAGARRRHGAAAIEFVFFLPLLVALWSIIFLVSEITLARSHASLGARNKAFRGRHEPWRKSDDYSVLSLPVAGTQAVGRILGQAQKLDADAQKLDADGGLLKANETRKITGFGPLSGLFDEATREHFVLAGTWDKQQIEFTKHSPLTLTDKVKLFHPRIKIDRFAALASFALRSGVGQALASVRPAEAEKLSSRLIGRAQDEAEQRVEQTVAELTGQINAIQSELTTLENALPRNESRIQSLLDRSLTMERERADLQKVDRQLRVTSSRKRGISSLSNEQTRSTSVSDQE